MSYNGSGTFNINSTGQPVVAGTVITASAFNALTTDLATGLTTAITKDGQTTTTARITFAQGITSSLVTDSSSVSTGSIITAGGAGIAKNLYVGVNANVAGTLGVTGVATFSAAPIYSSLTASSAVATDASKGLVSVTNTGTGNNVLATSPTLVTPTLGAASATSITVASGAVGTPSITTTGDTNTGIFFPAADTIAFSEGGAEAMRIDSSGNVGINTTSQNEKLVVNGAIRSTNNAAGATATADSGVFYFVPTADAPSDPRTMVQGVGTASVGASIAFLTGTSGSNAERMRIDSSGNLSVGTTSAPAKFTVSGQGGSNVWVQNNINTGTGAIVNLGFSNDNGLVGYVQTSGSSTTYVTSSDYRLKDNIVPMTGALAKVAQLKPVTYKWKVDNTQSQGFIAHELQEVVPECVTGTKDATREEEYEVTPAVKDEEGKITTPAVMGTRTVPAYQGVDTSFLVATLTAAIQELSAKNDALTARITALENA